MDGLLKSEFELELDMDLKYYVQMQVCTNVYVR